MFRKALFFLCLLYAVSFAQTAPNTTHGGLGQVAKGASGQIVQTNGDGTTSWVSAPLGVYGDGSDGSVTFDGTTTILGMVPVGNTYTMTRDIFCSSITVNGAATILTSGFRIYCTGTLTNTGVIRNNGNDAANNVAGAATSTGSLASGAAGGAGGNSGAGSNGGNTPAFSYGAGGNGGAGGASGAGQAGGTAGTVTVPVAAQGGANAFHSFFSVTTGAVIGSGASYVLYGGAGGSGAGSTVNNGGGGGGGGGVISINAWKINNTSGVIDVSGGKGGNGTGANSGSGGGGGGGLILLLYHSYTGNAATATAGAAGTTKTGTGVLGSAGSAGNVVSVQN